MMQLADPSIARGPGWFDSTWELDRGLDVREGWPADVPLGVWLDCYLLQSDTGPDDALSPSAR